MSRSEEPVYSQAVRLVGGATSPHVNIGDIRNFKTLCPPLEMQNQFSKMATKLFSKRLHLMEFAGAANTLFASLSQRAFRGELR